MTFGAWPIVSLAQARDQHIDARRVLQSGIDPMTQRKTQAVVVDESVTTFETVALAWHAHWKADKNPDYAMDVMTRLTRDIFPANRSAAGRRHHCSADRGGHKEN